MATNGPAVEGVNITRRSIRSPRVLGADTRQLAGHKAATPRPSRSANRRRAAGVQGGYACPDGAERRRGRGFCKSRYKFYRSRACRGTSLIGAGPPAGGSRCRMFVKVTGAVSRYKFYRSQSAGWRIMVQDLHYGQVQASGCKIWQDLSWEQGSAKTMTSPLIIPSVLGTVAFSLTII